jgi:hypothetical protein
MRCKDDHKFPLFRCIDAILLITYILRPFEAMIDYQSGADRICLTYLSFLSLLFRAIRTSHLLPTQTHLSGPTSSPAADAYALFETQSGGFLQKSMLSVCGVEVGAETCKGEAGEREEKKMREQNELLYIGPSNHRRSGKNRWL